MLIRNTIPLPVSIVLTLKYYIRNIIWKPQSPFLFIILPEHNNYYFISLRNIITKTRKRNIISYLVIKRISNNISPCIISSILDIPNIFVKIRFIIFVKSIEYLKFSNKNILKQNKKFSRIKRKKPRYFNKRLRLKSFVSIKSRIYLIRKKKFLLV
jgi:hypothetical protein